MRVVVLTPFGTMSQEAGLIYLLANYLREVFPDVVQLHCDGAFAVCDRDAEENWRREADTCLRCMADQHALAGWSGIRCENVAGCLLPEDIELTARWAAALPSDQLPQAVFCGTELLPLCAGSFRSRFGVDQPDRSNKNHVLVLRRMLQASARMYVAAGRFLKKFPPDISLIADGNDIIARTYLQRCREQGCRTALFQWDMNARTVIVTRPRDGEAMQCALLLDGIASMRPDVSTWPEELLRIVGEMLDFLEVTDPQLTLPIVG